MLQRLWERLRRRFRGPEEGSGEQVEQVQQTEQIELVEPPVPAQEAAPVKTMPPGTVTLIHDDGSVSSLPDPEEPSITYVVDALLAAQGNEEGTPSQ